MNFIQFSKKNICLFLTASLLIFAPTAVFANSDIYSEQNLGISLNYKNLNMQLEPVSSYIPVMSDLKDSVNLITLYLKPAIYKKTNLESAIFNLSVVSNSDKELCYNENSAEESYNKARKIQGNKWYYKLPNPKGSAAAGHSSLTETYRLYKNNNCYEAILQTSDFNIQSLDSSKKISKYSESKVFNRLGSVLNKLKVK